MKAVAKAIGAAVTTAGTALVVAVQDNAVSTAEIVTIIAGAAVAAVGVQGLGWYTGQYGKSTEV